MSFPDVRTIAIIQSGRFGVAAFLRDTCAIYRTGGSGRAVVATAEPCIVNDYAPGTNPLMSNYNQDVLLYVLTTAYTCVLKVNDEIIHSGFTYQVYEVLEDKSPLVFRQARMRKLS